MSGCNPASHKICKNNAITKTVYKVPEVNILVEVMFFFLFVAFLSKLGGFHGRETVHT